MFVPLAALVDRVDRSRRARATEAAAVRRDVRALAREPASELEQTAARRLRELRVALASAYAEPRACGGCARGRPLPAGRFDGGHCCSGTTGDVWTDAERAALALGGTRPRGLRPARDAAAGCAFRGATGCVLSPADRPNVCARYVCNELKRELHAAGRLASIDALVAELDQAFRTFTAARTTRLADEEWATILAD
jgi:hypothetical protein